MRIPALAVALVLAAATPSGAAPATRIADPVGDLLPVYAPGYDVVSATFATERQTLVVTVTYAGDVPTDPQAAQVVRLTVPRCGEVELFRTASGADGIAPCVTGTFAIGAGATGRTVTFLLPLAKVPHLVRGVTVTGLRTYTAFGVRRVGLDSGRLLDAFGAGPADSTRGAASYRIG